MSETAISVKNLSKKYRLFQSPRDRVKEALHPFRKRYHQEFWALKNVSFEVRRGQTVGILGRNGSGKSTLLQIIAGVMPPTEGEVSIQGSVSALLELGAGFNPEFTGRENVVLQAQAAGLPREEIEKALPGIEAFADIGQFFDQPVKTYSSGMFVRVAFAGAVHVDPDILIIDEALAVGDAKFQYKCYNKFKEFQDSSKTIIFVSHNTDAILRHCSHALLLDSGTIVETGDPKTVVHCYLDILFSGDLQGYSCDPVLVEADYHDFNIIRFRKKFYALPTSLEYPAAGTKFEEELNHWHDEQKVIFMGNTHEEVKNSLDKHFSKTLNAHSAWDQLNSQLNSFFENVSDADHCIHRKTYNKHEYRYGDGRAKVLDYLIVCGDIADPTAIQSGEIIDIYVKIKFFEPIMIPMTGFAIKTIDGLDVYAINTKGMDIQIPPILSPKICFFKWSVTMRLARGDYFIDVGCGEFLNGESIPLDRRYGIAHLEVLSEHVFAGLVKLETKFEFVNPSLHSIGIRDTRGS